MCECTAVLLESGPSGGDGGAHGRRARFWARPASGEVQGVHIRFRDGVVHHDGVEYDHLKRFRKRLNGVTTIESNPKYLDAVLELLGLGGAKDVPTLSVPAHKEKVMTGELLEPCETTVYRQCVGGLLYYTQDRADAQTRCRFWDRCW